MWLIGYTEEERYEFVYIEKDGRRKTGQRLGVGV